MKIICGSTRLLVVKNADALLIVSTLTFCLVRPYAVG